MAMLKEVYLTLHYGFGCHARPSTERLFVSQVQILFLGAGIWRPLYRCTLATNTSGAGSRTCCCLKHHREVAQRARFNTNSRSCLLRRRRRGSRWRQMRLVLRVSTARCCSLAAVVVFSLNHGSRLSSVLLNHGRLSQACLEGPLAATLTQLQGLLTWRWS